MVKSKKSAVGGESLKRQLIRDGIYKRYKAILTSMRERVDLDQMDTEAQALFRGRLSRNLKGTIPGTEKLIKALAMDLSYRSRLAELRVQMTKERDTLDIALKAMREHISSEFAESMEHIRLKGDRTSYVNRHIRTGIEFQGKMDSLIERFDFYIKDIDQSYWDMQGIIRCLELVMSDKNRVVA